MRSKKSLQYFDQIDKLCVNRSITFIGCKFLDNDNRVVLQKTNLDDCDRDYINASYIDVRCFQFHCDKCLYKLSHFDLS